MCHQNCYTLKFIHNLHYNSHYKLNFIISLDANNDLNFDFNYDYIINKKETVKQYIEDHSVLTYRDNSLELLRTFYHLQLQKND